MSKWITDREPTRADAPTGYVWVWYDKHKKCVLVDAHYVTASRPWHPIPVPDTTPAEQTHWQVEYAEPNGSYILSNNSLDIHIDLELDEEYGEYAQRIADIYNEISPYKELLR